MSPLYFLIVSFSSGLVIRKPTVPEQTPEENRLLLSGENSILDASSFEQSSVLKQAPDEPQNAETISFVEAEDRVRVYEEEAPVVLPQQPAPGAGAKQASPANGGPAVNQSGPAANGGPAVNQSGSSANGGPAGDYLDRLHRRVMNQTGPGSYTDREEKLYGPMKGVVRRAKKLRRKLDRTLKNSHPAIKEAIRNGTSFFVTERARWGVLVMSFRDVWGIFRRLTHRRLSHICIR